MTAHKVGWLAAWPGCAYISEKRGVALLTVDIEKIRADMRREARKFALQAVAAVGTAMAASGGLTALILHWVGKT